MSAWNSKIKRVCSGYLQQLFRSSVRAFSRALPVERFCLSPLVLYSSYCLPVCLSVYLSIYQSINLSIYLSICVSVCLCPSVCVRLSVCIPSLRTYLPTYLPYLQSPQPFISAATTAIVRCPDVTSRHVTSRHVKPRHSTLLLLPRPTTPCHVSSTILGSLFPVIRSVCPYQQNCL